MCMYAHHKLDDFNTKNKMEVMGLTGLIVLMGGNGDNESNK